jgi:tetratricopeptide (TPR) repeat protein
VSDIRQRLQTTLGSAYTLGQELTGGGMSRVFLAQETALGRTVVVKVLSWELTTEMSIERFNREILVAAKLQHPHIVPVLSAGDSEGLPFYTMPFVEGESLRVRLARTKRLPIPEVVGYLRDVAKALAYAHERGIVHRDIKPDNVLITSGSATVTDFGIAKALNDSRSKTSKIGLTQIGSSIGTPAYMSPEQASGDPSVDHRTDIYAFGCLAYELLTDRTPFTGTSPQQVLAAQLSERAPDLVELRPDTPRVLADLVMGCLHKDPDSRPQKSADLVQILETITGDRATPAARPTVLHERRLMRNALAIYAFAFTTLAILTKAAIVRVGLPDWAFGGSLIAMAVGLPVTLLAGPYRSWSRAALGGVAALGVWVAIVAIFLVMRALGIGPAATLISSGKLGQRDQIILADFRYTNVDSALGRSVSDLVEQGLAESSVIRVVSPMAVAIGLQRAQRPTATLDVPLAQEIALRRGYKGIIEGEVAAVDGGYSIRLRLLSADSLAPLVSLSARGRGTEAFINNVDRVTRELRVKAGESLRQVQRTLPLSDVTTRSLDALRLYSAAHRANSVERDWRRAIDLAKRAVEIDPTFAMAWRQLGASASSGGLPDSVTDSAFARAMALRDRVSERERVFITGNFYRSGSHRDRVKSIAAWETLLSMGNAADTNVAANYLGLEYASRREFLRADSLFDMGIRADSTYTLFEYSDRVMALANAGRWDDARRAAEFARRRFPSLQRAYRQSVELLYGEGKVETFGRRLDSLDAAGVTWAKPLRSNLSARAGKLREMRELRGQALTIGAPLDRSIVDEALLLRVEIFAGTRTKERLDSLFTFIQSNPGTPRSQLPVATTFAMAGRPDRARAVLKTYDARTTDTAARRVWSPAYHVTLGEILLAEQKFAEAITEFRRGDMLPDGPSSECPLCLPWNLARAFDAANQPDSAIVMYERYLNTPAYTRFTLEFDAASLAFVHRRLGALYDARGDYTKAAKQYRDFVELWKEADASLQPRVEAVRARLKKLAIESARR